MRVLSILTLLTFATGASADQFWIEYDASCGLFPEEVGWERMAYGGGAERWFEEGALVVDGRASIEIADLYQIGRPLDPSPDELFVMEWRLRIDEVMGFNDPIVSIGSYGDGTVELGFSESSFYSYLEYVWIDFTPGVFHNYRFTSSDTLNYELYIDGELAHIGVFVGPWYESSVRWGDGILGSSSLAAWEFVRFGIIPEPNGALLLCWAALALTRVMNRKKGRIFS